MQKFLLKVVYFARRHLFHTRLAKTPLAARVYALIFNLSAPDLTKPVVFRNVSLYVDPADRAVVPSIVAGYFEAKELDVFEALAAQAEVFFDVGANIGLYSVIGCSRSERLVSHAFEPVLENQRLLEKNIAAHGYEERIFVAPVAVSASAGTATISLRHSGTHSLEAHPGHPTRQVQTVTLDGFAAQLGRGPDLMKIDVEGHEPAVIEGAWEMLTRCQPTLLMEFIPGIQQDVDALVQRLAALFSRCFVVDEISCTVTEQDVRELHDQRACNVILTANPQHAEVVRSFVTA